MNLARLEELADELYGQGSAISLDHEAEGWFARVWDRTGEMVLWAWSKDKMTEARDELGKKLEEMSRDAWEIEVGGGEP